MARSFRSLTVACCATALILTAPMAASAVPGSPQRPDDPLPSSTTVERPAIWTAAADDTVPDPDTPLTFIADLPGDSAGLAAAARRASTPGRPGYRQFRTLKEAGRTFGPSRAEIRRLRDAARPLGVSVEIDITGVFAKLTASVSAWEAIYGQPVSVVWNSPLNPFNLYAFVNEREVFLATPTPLAPVVDNLIPYYQERVPAPGEATTRIQPRGIWPVDDTLPWPLSTGSPLGTTCDQPAIEERKVFTPAQTRDAYGISRLPSNESSGAAARIVVITQSEGYEPSQVDLYAKCFGLDPVSIREVRGMGVTTSFANLPGEDSETLLDLMTAMGALGTAAEITLVTEWADPIAGIGFLDGFARALDAYGDGRTVPDAVSLSYAGCELAWTSADYEVQVDIAGMPVRPMIDDVLALAAVVGTSVLSSTGDAGSYMCSSIPGASGEIAEPTIGYPASSPWITAVGGTRLTLGTGNRRVSEVVWNDAAYGLLGAGTGGPSSFYTAPWYQAGINPRGPRTVPDVSAQASAYWPVFEDDRLIAVGGTSGSTPFLAAAFGMLSARERLAGRPPLGFVNPWLYSLPRQAYYDVTEGSNQLAIPVGDGRINTAACCQAIRGYDMATGLGSPNLLRMSQRIPEPVPHR